MLDKIYFKLVGDYPASIIPLTKAGSNRQYFRLTGNTTVIGVIGTSIDENNAFTYLSEHFRKLGFPVPEVLAVSDNRLCYLQEDLGSVSLFDCRTDIVLLKKTIELLPELQYRGAEGLDFNKCYPVSSFNSPAILWDLNYFKYCFLNTSGISYREDLLEKDLMKIASDLSSHDDKSFMYRDFQSRNVMIKDNEPYFIDFQGGRRGPAIYDLVSFVNQARAAFSNDIKTQLIDTYRRSASKYISVSDRDFNKSFQCFSLLRNLQVLGAYGFRGRFERKPHFLESINQSLHSLQHLITAYSFSEYPYLIKTLHKMLEYELRDQIHVRDDEFNGLTVTVSSFSYKKGIPEDKSGNGGGFVFDCRGMDNPGRYDEYKPLTGLDTPVIDFLENKGEIKSFLRNCYELVEPSVECYIERNFTSLSINFGCTGGRHRSVYSAQKMAEHIKRKYPAVRVHLIHREQNIDTIL